MAGPGTAGSDTSTSLPSPGQLPAPEPARAAAQGAGSAGAAALGRAAHSEWIKLFSVASTRRSLRLALIASVGVGAILCSTRVRGWASLSAADRATFDATATSLAGLIVAQILLGAMAARFVTTEFTTGMIRTTLVAVPRRWMVLAAKAAVVAVVTALAGLTASLGAFIVGQQVLARRHIEATLSSGPALRAVLAGGLAVAVVSLLGLAIGTVVRHPSASVAVYSLSLFGVNLLTAALPASTGNRVQAYLPEGAVQALSSVRPVAGSLSTAGEVAVLAVWALVGLVIAGTVFTRRDA